jgi:ankyrin repeat and BTB/POZ domain-containing protein 1
MMNEDADGEDGNSSDADTAGLANSLEHATLKDGAETEPPHGAVYTLDGELAGDEFAQDAINYQILLNKIDALLDSLKLDA